MQRFHSQEAVFSSSEGAVAASTAGFQSQVNDEYSNATGHGKSASQTMRRSSPAKIDYNMTTFIIKKRRRCRLQDRSLIYMGCSSKPHRTTKIVYLGRPIVCYRESKKLQLKRHATHQYKLSNRKADQRESLDTASASDTRT